MGYLKRVLRTDRRQFGKVAYLRLPTIYDIREKANHGKGEKITGKKKFKNTKYKIKNKFKKKITGLPGACGGVEG